MTAPVPRWLRVRSDYPRATSHTGAWCRSDGEGAPDRRWVVRSAAHRDYLWSLNRRGVYDTRWTVLR